MNHFADTDLYMLIIYGKMEDTRLAAKEELLARLIRLVDRKLPSPRGWWRGKLVVSDNKGPMATGYWVFVHGDGFPPIETWNEIRPMPATEPERKLAELRKQLLDQRRDVVARRHAARVLANRRTNC